MNYKKIVSFIFRPCPICYFTSDVPVLVLVVCVFVAIAMKSYLLFFKKYILTYIYYVKLNIP